MEKGEIPNDIISQQNERIQEYGAVTRGICETNEEGYLTAVHETSNIVKTPEGAAVDNDGQLTSINAESYASMNMWGLTPEFML